MAAVPCLLLIGTALVPQCSWSPNNLVHVLLDHTRGPFAVGDTSKRGGKGDLERQTGLVAEMGICDTWPRQLSISHAFDRIVAINMHAPVFRISNMLSELSPCWEGRGGGGGLYAETLKAVPASQSGWLMTGLILDMQSGEGVMWQRRVWYKCTCVFPCFRPSVCFPWDGLVSPWAQGRRWVLVGNVMFLLQVST
jgi:hypothetical protein